MTHEGISSSPTLLSRFGGLCRFSVHRFLQVGVMKVSEEWEELTVRCRRLQRLWKHEPDDVEEKVREQRERLEWNAKVRRGE